MGWEDDLLKGQDLLELGMVVEAFEVAARLSADDQAIADSRTLRFVFHSACAVGETETAQAVAEVLRQSPDDEDQFTAASWWESLAADAYAEGRTEEAKQLLATCFEIAPSHREAFEADPRIQGLIPEGEKTPASQSKTVARLTENPAPSEQFSRTLARAREFLHAGQPKEAWDVLITLEEKELSYLDALRLGFRAALEMKALRESIDLGDALLRGEQRDRDAVLKFYLGVIEQFRAGGHQAEASNFARQIVARFAEYPDLKEDLRLKGLL